MPLPTHLETLRPAHSASLPSTPSLNSSMASRRWLVTVQPPLPDLRLLTVGAGHRAGGAPAARPPHPPPQRLLSGLLHFRGDETVDREVWASIRCLLQAKPPACRVRAGVGARQDSSHLYELSPLTKYIHIYYALLHNHPTRQQSYSYCSK